jgi:WXXGXW repeat (2 copies)
MGISFSIRSLLIAPLMLAIPVASPAQIILSIGFAPPPLPVYEQPLCPSEGYIWTPGYWAYAQEGYFWVPGTWAMAPEPGLLWTPGYWGWGDNAFVFNQGYWGAQIGFYGGVNYGFGYAGVGYQGGYWNNGAFFYNRSVNNVGSVTNVYSKTVINNTTVTNVSYNGGAGGISARPTAEEQKATSEKHVAPTSLQTQHVQTASTNHQLYESVNKGKPSVAATAKPGEFSGSGVVAAKAAAPTYKPVSARAAAPGAAPAEAKDKASEAKDTAARPATAAHASELKPAERPAPNTGNAKLDKKYTQEQTKLNTSQAQERQQLQKKQDQEHQQLTKTKASEPAKAKVEQKHQQQTQQVAQKHEAQQQKLQVKQQPAKKAPPAKPVAEKKPN